LSLGGNGIGRLPREATRDPMSSSILTTPHGFEVRA
jgi:hypothetical protein